MVYLQEIYRYYEPHVIKINATSIKSFEIMLDHINITLLRLQLFLSRLELGSHDLHLLYIFLSASFQPSLQEVPENQIYQPINQKHSNEQHLWEKPKESVVFVER